MALARIDYRRWPWPVGRRLVPPPVRCGPYTLEFGRRTYVMGIVNVTPDSFTDDGFDRDVEAAYRHALTLAAAGADMLDVGGESSDQRGGATISAAEEIDRVVPLIRRLARDVSLPISIDTWKADVAAAAIDAGAVIVNDVGGLERDARMGHVVAESGAPVIVMHDRPSEMAGTTAPEDLIAEVKAFFAAALRRAERFGIASDQVILDAGFGFGKSVYDDLALTRALWEFTAFGRPILHAPSQKRTIGRVLGVPEAVPERLMGTAAAVCLGVANGADIVRVHDVADMVRLVRMADALVRGYVGPDE